MSAMMSSFSLFRRSLFSSFSAEKRRSTLTCVTGIVAISAKFTLSKFTIYNNNKLTWVHKVLKQHDNFSLSSGRSQHLSPRSAANISTCFFLGSDFKIINFVSCGSAFLLLFLWKTKKILVKLLFYLFFLRIYAPGSGSGIRIGNADPDPDPQTQMNADPTGSGSGSGSTTLYIIHVYAWFLKKNRLN